MSQKQNKGIAYKLTCECAVDSYVHALLKKEEPGNPTAFTKISNSRNTVAPEINAFFFALDSVFLLGNMNN